MPVIIQLGQCGNQIGYELTDQLWNEGMRDSFFVQKPNGKYYARSVLVDMEPKVINQIVSQSSGKDWSYSKTAPIMAKSGSGNNWSFGYSVLGPRYEEQILKQVRKLAEDADSMSDGFLLLLAMAGGTGSGVGSRILQKIRDEFGRAVPIITHAVWPYANGEVVVQNYNTLLTLAALDSSSDGMIFHRNSIINDLLQSRFSLKNVSFHDLNRYIARELSSVFLPAKDEFGALHKMPIFQLASDLCSHPNFKSLTIRSLPQIQDRRSGFLSYSNELLLRYMNQLCLTGKFNEDAGNLKFKQCSNYTFAQTAYMRGKIDENFRTAAHAQLNSSNLYSPLLASSHRFNVYKTKKSIFNFESFLTTVSNDQTMLEPIDEVVQKSWDMFNNHSFLHRYEKYNVDKEHFIQSFAQIEQLLHSMKTLGPVQT